MAFSSDHIQRVVREMAHFWQHERTRINGQIGRTGMRARNVGLGSSFSEQKIAARKAAKFRRWVGDETSRDIELIEAVCRFIAIAYHDGRIPFEEADAVANLLWEYESAYLTERITPPILWDVFTAFDAGEYHRTTDQSDDPVGEFTNPAIAKIVSRFN